MKVKSESEVAQSFPTLSNPMDCSVKSQSEVAQLFLTLSDPMDCSLPGSSVHGIFQARVLEWVAIAFSISLSMSPKSSNLDFCHEEYEELIVPGFLCKVVLRIK